MAGTMISNVKINYSWHVLGFVILNAVDALLTTLLLAHGGVEGFWWGAGYNSNITVKTGLAMAIGFVSIRVDREELLHWLNAGMVVVVLSNTICLVGYFGSWLFWHGQIIY